MKKYYSLQIQGSLVVVLFMTLILAGCTTSQDTSSAVMEEVQETPIEKVSEKAIDISNQDKCSKQYSSNIVDLSFEYDSCKWSISEKIDTEGAMYGAISAKYKDGNEIAIKLLNTGMGGNYPGCSEIASYEDLGSDIMRIEMKNTEQFDYKYMYLTPAYDYGIKGHTGKYGTSAFENYFTFLNKEVYPNVNACWRSDGINPINAKNTKDIIVDATLVIEKQIDDEEFLKEADAFALEYFEALNSVFE